MGAHRLIRQEKRYRMLYTIFLFLILMINGDGSNMYSDSDTENDDIKSKDNNYDEEDVTPYLLGREQEYDDVLGNADVVEERPDYNMRRVSSKASIMMDTEDNKASNNNNFTFSDRNILAIVIFIGVIIGVLAITIMLLKTPTNFDSSSEDSSDYITNKDFKDNRNNLSDYSTVRGGGGVSSSTYKNGNLNRGSIYGTNKQNYPMYTQAQLYNSYNPYLMNGQYPSMSPPQYKQGSYGPVNYHPNSNYVGNIPTNAFGSNIFGGEGQHIPYSSRKYINRQDGGENVKKNIHLDNQGRLK